MTWHSECPLFSKETCRWGGGTVSVLPMGNFFFMGGDLSRGCFPLAHDQNVPYINVRFYGYIYIYPTDLATVLGESLGSCLVFKRIQIRDMQLKKWLSSSGYQGAKTILVFLVSQGSNTGLVFRLCFFPGILIFFWLHYSHWGLYRGLEGQLAAGTKISAKLLVLVL